MVDLYGKILQGIQASDAATSGPHWPPEELLPWPTPALSLSPDILTLSALGSTCLVLALCGVIRSADLGYELLATKRFWMRILPQIAGLSAFDQARLQPPSSQRGRMLRCLP